jgi:hypothetical protein
MIEGCRGINLFDVPGLRAPDIEHPHDDIHRDAVTAVRAAVP